MTTAPQPKQAPLVSIIIPVFNKADLTLQCLTALAAVTRHIPHEVTVVDNASTDGTADRVRRHPGNARLIRNETNLGFARGCNQGAKAARGKFLLFLNNDTVPLEGWLDPLVDELRSHPNVVAVGSKLLYESGLIQHAGVAFSRETRSPYHPHRLLRADDPRVNRRRELQAVTAACVLFRSHQFHEAGGFSEQFKNGYEDLDLCLRLRAQGGTIVYQPKSVLFHLESQTQGRMRHDVENRALFFRLWEHAILSDEDAFYFDDNYRLGPGNDPFSDTKQLIRIQSDDERHQWSVVARAQRCAAAREPEELERILSQTDSWPADAGVRRWAGAVCRRLDLHRAARRHFEAAQALEYHPEVELHLAFWNPDQDQPSAADATAAPEWKETLKNALQALRSGSWASAETGLETALLQGAPPRLVLPGLWRVASSRGASDHAELIRGNLLALPLLDSATRRMLEEPSAPSQPAARPAEPSRAVEAAPQSATTADLVSIIILTHNQLPHTRKCLESIERHTRAPYELILVDNGSTDGTVEFYRRYAASRPHVKVIANRSNRGFAAGNNLGLAVAEGGAVVFLNNDTIVSPGWLDRMLAVFDRHPETGLVGPVSNNVSGPQQVVDPAYTGPADLEAFAAQRAAVHDAQTLEASRLVGFCLLARRAVIDRIGGLDERFGSGNFEDDDFCIRARLAGFTSRIALDSFVHHTGSQTFKGARINYHRAMLRNWRLFKLKWSIPAETAIQTGYSIPSALPGNASLLFPLPDPAQTLHQNGVPRWWEEQHPTPSSSQKSAAGDLPGCAQVGQLEDARRHFSEGRFQEAWNETLRALESRPFHPDAYLLLAEIAAALGDEALARQCADFAQQQAPGWKKKLPKGQARKSGAGNPGLPPVPSPRSKPRLSVCLITKNEERFLERCLNSVKTVAGELIVVDTGSTDRTIEIARQHGANVVSFEWCDDFSAARNVALEHATGDWILVLDADEELLTPDLLLKEIQARNVIGYRLPLVDSGTEQLGRSFVPRLFRNVPGLFYTGRIHEQIFPNLLRRAGEWGLRDQLGTTRLLHHGYNPEVIAERDKSNRNLRLLKAALDETPDDPNLLLNMGLELFRAGHRDAGVEHYYEAFYLLSDQPKEQVVPELREVLLTQLASHLIALRRFDEAKHVLESPLANSAGLTASMRFMLGVAHLELNQPEAAVKQLKEALAGRSQPALSPGLRDLFQGGLHHCLALCARKLSRTKEAEEHFRAGIAESPNPRGLQIDFARFLFEQDRPIEALESLQGIIANHPDDTAAWELGGTVALSRPEFLEFARDWTEEAMKFCGTDPAVASQRGEALLLSGFPEPAAACFRAIESRLRPAYRIAHLICRILTGESAGLQPDPEPASSQAFLGWYRRLVDFGTAEAVRQLHVRSDEVERLLPPAGKVLHQVIAATSQ